MTKEELIKKVSNLYNNGECYNTFSLEEQLWKKPVKDNLCVEKHRWYETSISIFECSDGLLGIRLPSELYSETSEWCDLYAGIEFYDIEEVKEIVYKPKKID